MSSSANSAMNSVKLKKSFQEKNGRHLKSGSHLTIAGEKAKFKNCNSLCDPADELSSFPTH